jgi:hypothetical protein
MPDITTYHKLTTAMRRWPVLHWPLKKIRRLILEKIPMTALNFARHIAPASNPFFGPPRDSFSCHALLNENRCPGRIVLIDQDIPAIKGESLMKISKLGQDKCQPWPIFWSEHKNARLVSSSLALVDERKRLCRESGYGFAMRDDPAWNYFTLPKPVELSGNWTSIVSRWCPIENAAPFSHWLNDALPRLALLKEFPPDTKILVPCKLAAYQKETLQLLGLLDRIRYTSERHLILENYFFSSPTSMISCYNPYAINWMRSVFLPKADKSYKSPRRFIIQRKGKTRGIKNEAEVNEFFQRLGWEIIDAEKLTFAQEIELFANAEAFAGVLGSGFTNATWSSSGAKVITFVADNWLDGWVEWICDVNKLEYHWKIFPADTAMMIDVDLDEVKKILAKANLL